MNEELTPEIISEFYRTKFPLDKFMAFIGLSDFKNREFGFVVGEDRFIRNISFENTKALREFMATRSVKHAYVGAVYEQSPSRYSPIQKIKWKFREFIYDIDINDFDLVRTCGCQGYAYCTECWSLVQDTVLFIDETMRQDFGFTDITWLFSGRRGVHGWIKDKITNSFDQAQRVAILNYLTMVHDQKRTQTIEEIPNEAKPLRNRIYSIIAKSYLLHSSEESLVEIGIAKKKAKDIIQRVKTSSEFDAQTYNLIIPSNQTVRNKLSHEIILKRYPRIDRKVTMDTRRVSRMPYSIHGNTGQLAVVIMDIKSFYPDSAPNVWDALK